MNKLRHAAQTLAVAFNESPTLEMVAVIDTFINGTIFLALVWMVLR